MKKFPYEKLSEKETSVFKKLNTPQKIQDFLDHLPINFEKNEETLMSPRRLLSAKKAHCIEGALFAGAALWFFNRPPFLMDFQTIPEDEDHVVALFKEKSGWGAISKTNHAILRYRDPVYKNPRELAMSYFHEYQNKGLKSLRAFSIPFDLSKIGDYWIVAEENLWEMEDILNKAKHEKILQKVSPVKLRKLSHIEKKIHTFVEWKKK